jgi:hypothetical protein
MFSICPPQQSLTLQKLKPVASSSVLLWHQVVVRMRATLYSDQNLIELVDAWEPVVTNIQLHPAELQRLMANADVVARLRILLAQRSNTFQISSLTNEQICNDIVKRLASGEFRLLKTTSAPYPFAPIPVFEQKSTSGKSNANKTPATTAVASDSPVPENVPPGNEQCSSEGCEQAFNKAAENGTPLVEADGEGC